jgi:hypothetical protein
MNFIPLKVSTLYLKVHTYCECIFDGMLNEHKQILKNLKILITHPLFLAEAFLRVGNPLITFIISPTSELDSELDPIF